jgi:serine/threonine-protein kinase
MATVVAAEDEVLRRTVAVKVLSAHLAEDPKMVERFEREARTAASLSGHPNVVTIYDVGEHEGRPYIVMEHLPGGTVAEVLARGMPSPDEALRWLGQAADALDTAHDRGIVHRDVKPGNLLLDARRDLAVADFGIARLAESETLTAADEVLGTAAYISPEQALGEEASPASDRYSLAVVAYELLTGERPFRGESFTAQARAHIEDQPPQPSTRNPALPPGVDAVVLKALSKEPDRRFESASEFSSALRESMSGGPQPTVAMAPVRSSGPPVHARRGGWLGPALGALAAVALVVLLITSLGGGGKDRTGGSAGSKRATSSPTAPASAPASAKPATANQSSGAALNDRGFALMQQGRYADAIPILRRAVAAFPAGTSDPNYAYALFNLGRSLRLAGHPKEAIPILRRRLEIPNQRDRVEQELNAAMADAGMIAPAGSAPGKAKGGGKHGKKHEKGRD